MKRKIYVETSVISYLTARPSKSIIGAAHQQLTLAWWERRGQYDLMVSEVVVRECGEGNSESAKRRLEVVRNLPLLLITDQAIKIAEALIKQRLVPLKAIEDALHIAIATAHGVDYLVTWNCRHIANPEIQRGIASYLEKIGVALPFICTPEELLGEESNE